MNLHRTIARKTYRKIIARAARCEVMGDHLPEDVFVVGFPKSGNTWFQYLRAGLLTGLDSARVSDVLVQDLTPDVHAQKYYRRYCSPMLFKSHALPQPNYRRVIYLLRDGRDAMVSYFHHFEAFYGQKISWSKLVADAPKLPAKWHEHVEAWTINPYRAEILLVRYEDLKKDCFAEMKRVCAFLQLEMEDADLRSVVDAASFENMRRREKAKGWDDPVWPKDKPFVRRGAVGSFRDEMPTEALEIFMKQAGPALKNAGYIS